MDFATEEKLCRLAHDVWRQVATEPLGIESAGGPQEMDASTGMGHDGCADTAPSW